MTPAGAGSPLDRVRSDTHRQAPSSGPSSSSARRTLPSSSRFPSRGNGSRRRRTTRRSKTMDHGRADTSDGGHAARPDRKQVVVAMVAAMVVLLQVEAYVGMSPWIWFGISVALTSATPVSLGLLAVLPLMRKWLDGEAGRIGRACALVSLLSIVGLTASDRIRRARLEEAAVAGTAIVLAIERYGHENGKLPRRLEDLVPSFLDSVPHSPLRCCPTFTYEAGNISLVGGPRAWSLELQCLLLWLPPFETLKYVPERGAGSFPEAPGWHVRS